MQYGGVSSDLPLFLRFPRLRDALPRRPFLAGATPVEPLALAGFPAGALFVKRDERSCPVYGGNKPRKLEFLIGDACARGVRRLVTTGGLGTNHGLATTRLGREAGLATTLVLVHQPVTRDVQEKLVLMAAHGAELVYGGNTLGAAAQVLRVLARSALRGERAALVPTGGSSAVGNVGFVNAAFELADQVRGGALPAPASVWVPVGSGGTLAGLALGLRLSGLASRAVGVLVTDILPPSPRRLAAQARRTLERLRRADPDVPEVRLAARDFALVRDQLGAGYGAATPAAREAVAAAAAAGLSLETTYSGKCLAAIRDAARRAARDPGPILFWNTYNAVDQRSGLLRPTTAGALPPRLRRFASALAD
jgi:D-cysteine desulfhydrase